MFLGPRANELQRVRDAGQRVMIRVRRNPEAEQDKKHADLAKEFARIALGRQQFNIDGTEKELAPEHLEGGGHA